MPYLAGLQQIVTTAILAYSGYALATSPRHFLELVAPLTRAIERRTDLAPYAGGDDALALFGVALSLLASLFAMSIYTNDEKFKRNTTPVRCIIGFASYYLCTSPTHTARSSSLLALFGLFNLLTGVVLGLSIGFEDGNQVDLDDKERKRTALARIRAERDKGTERTE
ncbi:hypothetical protein JCM10212_005640 [Sporobolomyces blumeae]